MTILCPVCQSPDTAVIESRSADGRVKRRRECSAGHRFITHETVSHVVGQSPRAATAKARAVMKRTPARERLLAALPPEKRIRAEAFLRKGWAATEVARLYDINLNKLPDTPLT